jgi:hypothetical protein
LSLRKVAWVIAGIPIFIGILFLLIGALYWSHVSHESLLRCLYSDKDCSLASATWVLAVFTFSAFIAAGVAAIFAGNAYGLETRKILGQRLCAEEEHHRCPDVTLYVANTKRARGNRPIEDEGADAFSSEHHAFLNLGRVPLLDVAVLYEISFTDKAKSKIRGRLQLDCITVDGETHVTVYFKKGLPTPKLRWVPMAFEEGKRDLVFKPGKSYTTAASADA